LSDGEVEKFASQKNVLESVLRAIPLKRRFHEKTRGWRNLVGNPVLRWIFGWDLMKHLLTQELKNLSANKEVSETIRKLALKMYKQKPRLRPKNNWMGERGDSCAPCRTRPIAELLETCENISR